MSFLRSLFGLKPPAPKATDDAQSREAYVQWVRKQVEEAGAAHQRRDYGRRDSIWAEFRAEAIATLTLAEVVEIDKGFLLEWKAESLTKPLKDASTAEQVDELQLQISRLETLAGPALLEDPRVCGTLRLHHYKGRLRLLKAREAIRRDTLMPLETAADGTQVFARERATHKREDGWLTLTNGGVVFEGMVRIEFPWAQVKMIAIGGSEGDELGFQEGKRRTATKFMISDSQARECAKAIAEWLWRRATK